MLLNNLCNHVPIHPIASRRWQKAGRDDAKIINASETSIRAEFHTTLGFVDDAIFVMDKTANAIQVRSASRSGYWDLGKNRHRLEEIRLKFLGGE